MNGGKVNFQNGMQAANVADCQARALGHSNLVMCLTEVGQCCWRHSIGNGTFCGHSLNSVIANASLPVRQFLLQPAAAAGGNG